MSARSTPGEPANPALACAAAWLVPGAGHFVVGQHRKAVVFFVALSTLYVVGLALGGRLFPLEWSEPLVFLSAIAQWMAGLARIAAAIGHFGEGDVVAASYEYGNTFLIVSGLLNSLVVLDAYDRATGRKPAAE
jgi:hypothetical protein